MRPGIKTDNGRECCWKQDSIQGDGEVGVHVRVHPWPSSPGEHGALRTAMAIQLPTKRMLIDGSEGAKAC